jgi:hypothetical protein
MKRERAAITEQAAERLGDINPSRCIPTRDHGNACAVSPVTVLPLDVNWFRPSPGYCGTGARPEQDQCETSEGTVREQRREGQRDMEGEEYKVQE